MNEEIQRDLQCIRDESMKLLFQIYAKENGNFLTKSEYNQAAKHLTRINGPFGRISRINRKQLKR